MRILIINPNISVEFLRTIDSVAKECACPRTEITTVSPQDGPEVLTNEVDMAVQVPKVIKLVEENIGSYDAFIIACGFDPGLAACRRVTRNVIGIGESAIMSACAIAKRFSFLQLREETAPLKWDLLRSLGIDRSRCASVRVVPGKDIIKNRHQMLDAYCQVGRKCIEEDGAETLILSCAGIVDLKGPLEERLGVPVISSVVSAVKIAEQLPPWGR